MKKFIFFNESELLDVAANGLEITNSSDETIEFGISPKTDEDVLVVVRGSDIVKEVPFDKVVGVVENKFNTTIETYDYFNLDDYGMGFAFIEKIG